MGQDYRVVHGGTEQNTNVVATDTPGAGGACHDYEIHCLRDLNGCCATIHFQKGPIHEAGVNGCSNEDLLAVVADRLEHFQKGPFPCEENAAALVDVRHALSMLRNRTADRQQRGVEGRNLA